MHIIWILLYFDKKGFKAKCLKVTDGMSLSLFNEEKYEVVFEYYISYSIIHVTMSE